MSKQELEQMFREKVLGVGGLMHKNPMIKNGDFPFPEWIVILPGGCIGFVEIYPEKGKLSALKLHVRELRLLGCAACVIGAPEQINRAMMYILSRAGKDSSWFPYLDKIKELERE